MKAIIPAMLGVSLLTALIPCEARAWGDDGHKTVALIAEHYLTTAARDGVTALLASDPDDLTGHDIADAATWADRYRDANHRKDNYDATKRWHFVDLEISAPDLTTACAGRAPLPAGTPASRGDKNACVVDKVSQFAAELAAPGTDAGERVYALKFLLHLLGDMHQPLHASDNGDAGGNRVKVTVAGFDHKARDELHGFWDTQFVDALGGPPAALAKMLVARITPAQIKEWQQGTPDDWAMEAFAIARADVYGEPPLSGSVDLDAAYVERAKQDVALQLSRAGVRLALVLDRAFAAHPLDPPVR